MNILTPGALEAMHDHIVRAEGQYLKDMLPGAFNAAPEQLRREGRLTEGNTTNPSITIWLLSEDTQ